MRGFDGGALLASDGGVIAVGAGDPVFHAASVPMHGSQAGGVHEAARLARVGGSGAGKVDADRRPAVIALCGPNAWIWQYAGGIGSQPRAEADQRDAFWVIDARDW